MGERLNRFQDYFNSSRPLAVTGRVGEGLASAFSFMVNDIRTLDTDRLVLASAMGEMVLYEEEIYRISEPGLNRNIFLEMDGGVRLEFTPISMTGNGGEQIGYQYHP